MNKLIYNQIVTDDMLRDQNALAQWCKVISDMLNSDEFAGVQYEVLPDRADENASFDIRIIKKTHGIGNEQVLHSEFFQSGEYRSIVELGQQLESLVEEGAYVQRGERKQEVAGFKQAMEWLLEESRRGLNIQRYKGLGEMNPDQLYETTLNSDTRRLLQVQIEDVVAADIVFTTLMGDQVEPRREFIEQNALSVANLDV
jgi:DNA gyrase subunit B